MQSDGKVVVGGSFTSPSPYLARFNADGTADTAFNTNVGTTLNGLNGWVLAVAVQPDGKVVVGGSSSTALLRFNADGSPDLAFGNNTGIYLNSQVNAVAVQSDGKILAAGNFTSPSNRLARFNSDGTPDAQFNTTVGTTLNNSVWAIGVQSDGGVVVGGDFTTNASPSLESQYLARFSSAGVADNAGFNTAVGTTLNNSVWAMRAQPVGKIVVGGDFTSPANHLAAFDDGKSDQTINFGTLADKSLPDSPVTVSATASSGLEVSFTTITEDVCKVSGTSLTLVSAGTCTVRASQAGDASYNPASPVTQSFTVETAQPNPPTGVSMTATGKSTATVSWSAPVANGVAVSGYRITASPGGRTWDVGSTRRSWPVKGLAAGQVYTFTVKAKSSNGDSAASAASAPVTVTGAPGVVTGLNATPGNGQAVVSFSPPANTGGLPISGYELRINSGRSWVPVTSGQTVSGLTNGARVSLWVRAVNAEGNGKPIRDIVRVGATP